MIFDQTVVESFRIAEVKRGGSNPSRAFLLLREFQKFQQRFHYNRRITVSERHKLQKMDKFLTTLDKDWPSQNAIKVANDLSLIFIIFHPLWIKFLKSKNLKLSLSHIWRSFEQELSLGKIWICNDWNDLKWKFGSLFISENLEFNQLEFHLDKKPSQYNNWISLFI